MADHRAEQIAAAVKTTLTGLTTTGPNVFRSRATSIAAKSLPAVLIRLVADNVIDSDVLGTVQRTLGIDVAAYATAPDETAIESTLNLIRKETTVALQTDTSQGLAFVIDTVEGDTDYELTPEGEQVLGVARTAWQVIYRTSRSDPSA